MKTIEVRLKENSYPILVGRGILSGIGPRLKTLNLGTDAVVVTNPVIKKHHGTALVRGLRKAGFGVQFITVPSGEKSKSAPTAFAVIQKAAALSVGKKPFVVAFGGGVVGDLAGYVAAAYKRGIPYIQIPTTLLAQIDSAIGGKVGVDLPVGKNLVGAFYQPKAVISDVDVLDTLTKRQVKNGLAEAVKYGVIDSPKLFAFIEERCERLLSLNKKDLIHLVEECSRIKAKVVMKDEKETKGIRSILNFGHTIGHAIEAANRFKDYHHGEAIALGMRVAAEISRQKGMLRDRDVRRLNALISAVGLPAVIRNVKPAAVLSAMRHDKKFQGKKNRFILAERIGKVKVVDGVEERIIQSALKTFMP